MAKQTIFMPSESMAKAFQMDIYNYAFLADKLEADRVRRLDYIAKARSLGMDPTEKSIELQTAWNKVYNEFKKFTQSINQRYGVNLDLNYRENAQTELLDKFDVILATPDISQGNVEYIEDLEAMNESVNAMNEVVTANMIDYFGENDKLNDIVEQAGKSDDEYRKEALDMMKQFMPIEAENVLSNEEYENASEKRNFADKFKEFCSNVGKNINDFTSTVKENTAGTNALDFARHPLLYMGSAIEGTKVQTMIDVLTSKSAYELAGNAYHAAYNAAYQMGTEAIAAGNVALDTVKDAAKDAAANVAKECGEIYKKAGEKFNSVIERAKNFCKQCYLDAHKTTDRFYDIITLGCYSKIAEKNAIKAFENIDKCQARVDTLTETVKSLKQQLQESPSAGTKKLLHEAMAELTIAKASLLKNQAYNFGCPYKSMDEAKTYWAEVGVGNFGKNRDGEFRRSPIQALEDTAKAGCQKLIDLKNQTITSAKVLGYSVQTAAYDAKASIYLALENACDKQISKIQSRINALKQVDQNIAQTKNAINNLQNQIDGLDNNNKYIYVPSEKITNAIKNLESIKESHGGTLTSIQQWKYDKLQETLAKDIQKGQAKLNDQKSRDFADLQKQKTNMEISLDDLEKEKEKADRKIEALENKIEEVEAKRGKVIDKKEAAMDKSKETTEKINNLRKAEPDGKDENDSQDDRDDI